MIKVYQYDDIISSLAAILTYGLNHGYSPTAIEERTASSSFVFDLERGEYDEQKSLEQTVEDAYEVKLMEEADISFRGLFFAESYYRLFLALNRSFEYLFLYWPVSRFLETYGVYHEMDFSSLLRDFQSKVKETPLLKKLCLAREIKRSDLSRLTGINENSLAKYASDDRYLSGASFDTLYDLAKLFKVKMNLFASDLGIYPDLFAYLGSNQVQAYRNYLGFYYACLFDSRIDERDFAYDEKQGAFLEKDGKRRIVAFSSSQKDIDFDSLPSRYGQNDYFVLFDNSLLPKKNPIDLIDSSHFLEVMVATSTYIHLLNKGKRREITDTIARSLQVRACRSAKRIR